MLARKSLLIVGSQFFIRFIGWIGLLVLAKLWGGFAPEALGIIGFAMSFLAVFNVIGDLGFNSAHVKRVSEGKDLGTCIGTYIAIKIILICLMLIVIFSAIFIWKNVLHESFADATTESVVYVFIVYYIFFNLAQIAVFTFQAKREIAKRQITGIFENIVKIPLEIFVAFAGVSIASISISPRVNWPFFLQPIQRFIASHAVGSLAMSYVFGMMATFFVGMWFLRSYPIKKPSLEMIKSYLLFALPIMLISIIGIISVNIDKVMIGYFWTSTEVGYYFSVQQILGIVLIISSAVGIVLFPTLSEHHSNKDFEKIKETTHLVERYISMIIIPQMVVIIVFVKPVINIMLSDAFLPASSVLITLTIFAFITSLNMPYSSLIGGIDKPGVTAKIGVAICVINITLNYLLIPQKGLLAPFGINGPTGAAVATVSSNLTGFFALRIAAKKLTGIKLLQTHIPRHVVAGLIMAGILYYTGSFFSVFRWYHLLSLSLVGLGIYIFILFLMKEFKKEDLTFFLDLLHPKKMFNYVTSELKDKEKFNRK